MSTATQTRTIQVIVDTTTARAQIAALQNSIRGVNSVSITTASGASGVAGAIQNIGRSAVDGSGALGGLANALSGVSGGFANLRALTGSVTSGLGSLASGLGGVAAAGAAAAVALPVVVIGALAGSIFDATAKVQDFKASLQGVLGNANDATEAFAALGTFAAKTPFTLEQAVTGFTKLRALGLEPSERAMTSYGNTAAALGKNLDQMVEAVADAATGEFERLKEFGIKAKQSGDQVAFTFQGVTTTVGKNSQDIQDYLLKIGETNFAGAMDIQAKTINGSLSTLSDSIFLMFAKLGEGQFATAVTSAINTIADVITNDVQPALMGMMSFVEGAINLALAFPKALISSFGSILPSAKEVGSVGEWIGVVFDGLGAIANVAASLITSSFETMATAQKAIGNAVASVWEWAFGSAGDSSGLAARRMDKDSAWASTRLIDRVRGYIAAFQDFAKRIPTIFQIAISAVGSMFNVLGDRFNRLITGDFVGAFSGIGAQLGAIASQAAGAIGKQYGASVAAGRAAALQSYADSLGGESTGDKLAKFGLTPDKSSAASSSKDKKAKKDSGPKTDYEGDLSKYLTELTKAANLKEAINTKSAFEITLSEQLGKAAEIAHRALNDGEKARITSDLHRKVNAEGLTVIESEIAKIKIASANDLQSAMDKALYGEREGETITKNRLAMETLIADLKKSGTNLDDKNIAARIASFKDMLKAQADTARIIDLAGSAPAAKITAQAANDNLAANRSMISSWMDAQLRATASGVEGEQERERIRALGTKAMDGAFEKWKKDIEDAGSAFRRATDEFADGISQIFGDKAGVASRGLSGLIEAFNSKSFGQNWDQNTNPQSGIGKITKGLQQSVEALGGSISKGLGKALGQLGVGAEIGNQVADIGQLFSKKFSRTGSQVGGALGNVVAGPIGGLIGSIAGGIIGSIFKKTKSGYAVVTNSGISGGGNSADLKAATQAAGEGLQDSISKIASQLGATVGDYAVSIGKRSSGWISVSASGSSQVADKSWKKANSGGDLIYDGKDETEALKVALRNAIQDGAIAGIRASTKALLLAGKDIDTQLSKATTFENAFKELAQLTDPVGAGITSFTKDMDNLTSIFKEAGASSQEWADLEQLRQLKFTKLMEDSLSTLNDFRASLFGDGSGVTKLNQLTAKQSEWESLKAQIAAGANVDQSKLTSVGQELFSLASAVYGTSTSQFQAIRSDLIQTTDGAISAVQSKYEQAQADAVAAQQAVATNTAVTNDLLSQILERMNAGTATSADYAKLSSSYY
ncbi:tape measure protein [Novosphingobium sp. EMRT-2]|uniref:tape measure protein n=1 Tax=Novosphingobium sp. EMRT-2 TaxID=2571749 RepID=UPI0010BD609B|nr:tape measure protein [Novosphingobium sp. EMRT-2]QCI92602.1 hypothetical protein FA702_02880 [Novosphingobium sp. EMRT-2]